MKIFHNKFILEIRRYDVNTGKYRLDDTIITDNQSALWKFIRSKEEGRVPNGYKFRMFDSITKKRMY